MSRFRPWLSAVLAAAALAAGFAACAPVSAADEAPALAPNTARIHYHRPRGDYEGWGLHTWEDAAAPTQWGAAMPPAGRDGYGPWWDVALKPSAAKLGLIVHKGDQKDPGPDMFLDVAARKQAWIVSGRNELAASPPDVSALAFGDLSRQKAHWVDRTTLLWPTTAPAGAEFRLYASPDASLRLTKSGVSGAPGVPLRVDAAGISPALRERFPYLAGSIVLKLDEASDSPAIEWLRGQLAIAWRAADGASGDATGLQIPGVLDDLLAWGGDLGVTWNGTIPSLRVWAPTARAVRLLIYDGPRTPQPVTALAMTRDHGTWTATGTPAWKGRYYLYEVTVFTPSTGRIETVTATDPYSRSLSRNGERSQVVDLRDAALKPEGWDALTKPPLERIEDASVYELHVRDFSVSDTTVPATHRGGYLAFTDASDGTRHLRALAEAGLTHVHLLPVFDFATVDEDRSLWQSPGDLSKLPADSDQQQAASGRIGSSDAFNWGYDPAHYGVPEGSYASDPDGTVRVVEFRRMVQGLASLGLRVVMDVVYNHTHASGLAEFSVLDRIVPGYYQRLNADGAVENSTCCANTASEHRMMEKLMVDDLVHWARDYKVDGFRFDLMGHHMKRNLEAIRDRLAALTLAKDGVDGTKILLYGEGWDFGEVQGGKRGVNATQKNLAGTGVGTFNDRLRDAVRGGNPFGDRREQGFATGLFTLPGEFNRGGDGDRAKLLDLTDRIRVGLAGNLAGYRLVDRRGTPTTGAALGGTGYTASPRECVNYVEAHDNETLWDKVQYAAPAAATLEQRARMQVLALSVPALAQGLPFFHAGGEILRSKAMDADSYDSGDWFNRIDWSRTTNHWGMGLPGADKNRDRWNLIRPLVGNPALAPRATDIDLAFGAFRDLLRVRRSTPLFRLATAEEVQSRVAFLNTGPAQVPGLIVMTLSDAVPGGPSLGSKWKRVVVVFNARPEPVTYAYPGFAQAKLSLHPAQAGGADLVVKGATFDAARAALTVPGLTTAVFVSE
jgi:pullulanase